MKEKKLELFSVKGSIRTPRCLYCIHFFKNANCLCCEAYPHGIPMRILAGGPHNKVQDDQEGDYVFEPEEGWTEEDWRAGKI